VPLTDQTDGVNKTSTIDKRGAIGNRRQMVMHLIRGILNQDITMDFCQHNDAASSQNVGTDIYKGLQNQHTKKSESFIVAAKYHSKRNMTTMLSLYNAFGGGAFNKENCQKTKMRQ
jgi:hypothetical protein